jgi:transmembrane sensor
MTAVEIEDRAALYLLRQEEPGWSRADQAELDAWLDQDAAHKVAFWRLEHGWKKTGRLAALRPATASAPPQRTRAQGWGRDWRPMAAAASMAMVIAAGAVAFGSLGLGGLGHATYTTEVGGRQTVPLKDGTRVELNTDTRLRTAVDGHGRHVWLDRGEAYFEVAHDASRPFVVYAGTRRITVLGTKFSVRRDGERVTVAVVEGRVRVDPVQVASRATPELVTRGDIVIAQGASTLVAPKSVEKVAGELSWRRGMLTFDQTTLAQAAAEFNRYNTRKLVIGDPIAAQSRIGGTFEAENVEAFARLLHDAYGLKVEDGAVEVKISS